MTVRTGVVDVVEEAPRPEPDGGLGALRTERGNLPLELVEVRSSVAGLAVRTELAQGFRNPYDVPLEATYIFPLPDRAAVTRLRMEAADRVVEGVVKEREAARADYDAAVSEGKRASIAEEERPGVFTLRVGNIMPGERVVVRTTLSGRLPYEDGQATFRFPLVVAPRYIPGAELPGEQVGSGTSTDTDQVPDASRISPPILLPGFPNPVRLSIEVEVDPVGLPLAGLTSSLHGVSVEQLDGERRLVRLDPGARADRDFVLRLGYGGAAAATSLAVAWDEDGVSSPGTFLLTVLPPEPTDAVRPRDVALVLDRSGSMQGWKMAAARRAAARIVDTLTAADRFVVLTFDDVLETPDGLTDGLVEGTDRHRFRAVRHLAAVEARGGTEMEPPLRRAAALLAGDDPGRDRVLILVTDGQVGNEDRLLKVLGQKLAHIRVHTVGIDSAVNAGFLRRLATLGGGHCELVESEDRLDEAMDAVHRRIGTPLVTGLRLAGTGGLEPDQDSVTPGRLPDLFAGAPLVVAGRIVKSADRSGAESDDAPGIVITGKAADGSAWTRTVAATETADAGLAQFWARGRIRDLEDRYVSTYDGLPEIEQAIVATSVRHSVLSRFTAFVVVDTRVVAKGGALKQVTQPVDLPDSWETDNELDDAFLTMSTRSVRTRGGGVAMPKMSPAGPGFGGSLPQAAPPAGAPVPPMPPVPLMAQPAPAAGAPVPPMPSVPPVPPVPPRPAMPAASRWEPVPDPSEALDFAMAEESRRDRPSPDDLQDFATIWLPRLIAAANDTAEAQEELLTEFIAKLRDLSPSVPGSLAVAELLDTLESSDKPVDERRHSAIAFLESLKPVAKPRRTPFWKR